MYKNKCLQLKRSTDARIFPELQYLKLHSTMLVYVCVCSVAKCLGAKKVCRRAFDWLSQHPIISLVVSDKEALAACVGVADDHHVLVAPACGAALATVYGDMLRPLQDEGKLPLPLGDVVVIVCGGSGVSVDTLLQWKTTLATPTSDM